MDEFALTALCLTPLHLTWEEFHERVVDLFTKDRPGPASVSDTVSILGTRDLKIVRVMTLERALAVVREDKTLNYWRRMSVETYVAGVTATVSFLFLRTRDGDSTVEVRFPSKVNVAIQGESPSEGHFDEDAKRALVYLMVEIAAKLEAAGFGYGLADEDRLLGAADEAVVRRYVAKGIGWVGLPQRYMIAGLHASRLEASEIELDREDKPLRYAVGNYHVFDRLWPD